MSFYEDASLIMLKDGAYNGGIKSLKPADDNLVPTGVGDFTVARNSIATFVGSDGLIQTAAINVPRFDFSNGSCPELLVEPQSTNLITWNSDLKNPVWAGSNLSVSSPFIGGVGGTYWELQSSGVSNAFNVLGRPFFNTVTGDYSYYVIAKKGTTDNLIITTRSGYSFQDHYVSFDLSNGSVLAENQLTGKISPITHGWYKCEVNFNKSSSGIDNFSGFAFGFNYGSSVGDTLFVSDPQCERLKHSTSPIETEASTVTRLADEITGAGDVNTFNSSEGILFLEASVFDEGATNKEISISDGTSSNRVLIRFSGTSITGSVRVSGVDQYSFSDSSATITNSNKIALKYKENDFSLWINGIQVNSSSSGSIFPINTLNVLNLNDGGGVTFFYGRIKQILTFNDSSVDISTL